MVITCGKTVLNALLWNLEKDGNDTESVWGLTSALDHERNTPPFHTRYSTLYKEGPSFIGPRFQLEDSREFHVIPMFHPSHRFGFRWIHDFEMVARGVRLPGGLWGEVWGTRDEPYEVTVTPGEWGVRSSCSCPVGHMCKHGVAVALQWLDDPRSFSDLGVTMSVLRQLDREELLDRLEGVISSRPGLLFELDLAQAGRDATKDDLDPGAVDGWVERALSGRLDYNHVFDVVRELDRIRGLAEELVGADRPEEAAEVSIRVFEGCVEAYELGADDSSGSLGTTANMASELFVRCMDGVDDETFRSLMLERVLAVRELGDDYGLDQLDPRG